MNNQGFFYRDTWAEVDLDCITENLNVFKEHLPQGVDIFAVVKANAYGHGDLHVAKTALNAGATYLAVAFMDEAIALRNKGISAPILVLGASRPEDAKVAVQFNLTLTIFQKEWLEEARKHLSTGEKLSLHIKVDTGMGRLGVRTCEELSEVEQLIIEDDRFYFEGIFTHYATADELNNQYFKEQYTRFEEMIHHLKTRPKYIHTSNSAAAIRFPKAYFNAVRIGISMYGLTPSIEMKNEIPFPLREAFSMQVKLVNVKRHKSGDKVSYGATYGSVEDEWIGTLPIGYADGWLRKLQGQEVLVDGQRVPIVGRICMDQCMIRLPYYVPIGTQVTLIGRQGDEFISINEIAAKLDTINYEVPCVITKRVPRVYKQGGKVTDIKNDLLS
ncbi:alanine racemase [Bacillus sp. BRMEA1]|uniref:alanine racemase n=1 Tax=Neobacillus endophyticus TaxID=2738405 RepID=UPI0015661CF3|nr:alanine racemase [Neobacillus endophyticus]NRD77613.1 alanine racemase [Neobacillus endophyticus]